MENTYKKDNFRKFTKQQFFNHVSDSFNDFRSQADMNRNNVIKEVPLNYFDFFQMRFGYKWAFLLFGIAITLGFTALGFLNPIVPFENLGLRAIVGATTLLGSMLVSGGLLGISTFFIKHSKRWGIQYKKYRINDYYQELYEMRDRNKKLKKAIEERDLYAFEVEFNKMKEINSKIWTLINEMESDASKLSKSKKNDELREYVALIKNNIRVNTSLCFELTEYELELLKEEDMANAKEVLNDNSKTLSNINKKQQTKNKSLEEEDDNFDEFLL